MKIQVLGSGCASCKNLHKAVVEVAKRLSPDLEVEYSTDITKIIELGAMSSPVFAIDNEVVSTGKTLPSEEIEKAICARMDKGSSCCGGC